MVKSLSLLHPTSRQTAWHRGQPPVHSCEVVFHLATVISIPQTQLDACDRSRSSWHQHDSISTCSSAFRPSPAADPPPPASTSVCEVQRARRGRPSSLHGWLALARRPGWHPSPWHICLKQQEQDNCSARMDLKENCDIRSCGCFSKRKRHSCEVIIFRPNVPNNLHCSGLTVVDLYRNKPGIIWIKLWGNRLHCIQTNIQPWQWCTFARRLKKRN